MKTNNSTASENFEAGSANSINVEQASLRIEKFSNHPPACHLPPLLQKCADVFIGKDERELFIYSMITAISGLLTKVTGVYAQKIIYPNMFFMVLAPAASGKGAMGYARQALQPIHKYYLNRSNEALKIYQRTPKKTRGNPPPFRVVFLPGNSSSSKMLQHLSINDPDIPLILFETEMDTINVATGSDFGQYSDVLRKAFQNEPVSQSRRTDNEFFDIEKPKIAIVISGTPGQLFKFINNKSDGLLSRFLVMNFKNSEGWKNVAPCSTCPNLSDFFDKIAPEYLEFYNYISNEPLEVKLTRGQWACVDSFGKEQYDLISKIHGEEATSIIKRHNLILFKICMVLTSLRKFEEDDKAAVKFCGDEDFITALYLIKKSLLSGLDIYEALPGEKTPNLNNDKQGFYKSLPASFTRAEAIALAKTFAISERSVDRYLKEFVVRKLLSQTGKGKYIKN